MMEELETAILPSPRFYSHGPHVVLRQQRDLQHLGVVVQDLVARRGHRLARDAVDLVEGVGPEQPVVSGADEQLQGQRFVLHVAVELREQRSAQWRLSFSASQQHLF